jgi:triosephosphate isomerase
MNLNRQQALALTQAVLAELPVGSAVDVAVCPPLVYLDAVAQTLAGSSLQLGAQNVYFESVGAFTGEVSAAMVRDVGCRYVILGHSERRNILGETNAEVNRKVHAVLAEELIPIVCVGELLEQREAGQTMETIAAQFTGSFAEIREAHAARCVIAYEPVWAIGTGRVATPAQAEEVHAYIRQLLTERFGADVARSVRIQYGGSVKPENAAELLAQPNIDGALVGGAALKADSFLAIVRAAAAAAEY